METVCQWTASEKYQLPSGLIFSEQLFYNNPFMLEFVSSDVSPHIQMRVEYGDWNAS